jgi:PII-like signaling protein
MKTSNVIIARVYIRESAKLLNEIVNYLKTDAKIRGVSVFRAVGGYGDTGEHTAFFIDLSLNLPIVIEFFDCKEKIEPALEHLSQKLKPEHIVFWEAKANE